MNGRMSELQQMDPEIANLITREEARQHRTMRLIPSENYAWPAVMEACGSVLNNKYSEGYPRQALLRGPGVHRRRRVAGHLAASRPCSASDHANVQPYSGSPANLAVYFAFCKPGDTVMGMGLPSGGHLTHGWNVSISGAYFNACSTACASRTTSSTSTRSRRSPASTSPSCSSAAPPPTRADRLRALRRDRARGGRHPGGRHRAHQRPRRRRRAPEPGGPRRGHHLHHAQDPARPARRHDPVRREAPEGHRQGGVPGPPGRAPQRHHRGHRGGRQAGHDTAEFKQYAANRWWRTRASSASASRSVASRSSPAAPTTTWCSWTSRPRACPARSPRRPSTAPAS
jgi:hypothetical protein